MLFAPSGKGRKRQKKGEKGRFRSISKKGGQPPLKPPFVTPPFAAAQVKNIKFSCRAKSAAPKLTLALPNVFQKRVLSKLALSLTLFNPVRI